MTIGRQENFDIYTYPENAETREHRERVALGDGHGNFIKLLAFLIQKNVIANPTPAHDIDYGKLVEIYQKSFVERMKNDEPRKLMSLLSDYTTTEFTSKTSVLNIGDDLADRGGTDIGVLMVYALLTELKVDYSIIASNHGLDFLYQFFSVGGLTGPVVSEYMLAKGAEGIPENYYARSLKALRDHINGIDDEREAIEKELAGMTPLERLYESGGSEIEALTIGKFEALAEINRMVQESYIKHLKVLAYDFDDKGGIILYSHAPKHPAEIVQLYNELKYALVDIGLADLTKEFNATTREKFAESIDQMNVWFQQILEKPELFTALMMRGKPLHKFINTRYENLIYYDDLYPVHMLESLFGNFPIKNVHGHVGDLDEVVSNIDGWSFVNLDNNLGQMMPNGENRNRGLLKTFVTNVNTLDHSYKEEKKEEKVLSPDANYSDPEFDVIPSDTESDKSIPEVSESKPKDDVDVIIDAFLDYKTENAKDASLRSSSSLWKQLDNDDDKDDKIAPPVPPPPTDSRKPKK